MNEQCEKINLLLGMLNAGEDASALFPLAREAALAMLDILSQTPPFSYKDIPKHREQIEKAEKLNNIVKKFGDEQKIAQKATIEDMRKIVELLEKNLNGKLSTGDMVEAEKQLEHWKRELDSMTEIVKKILVEV